MKDPLQVPCPQCGQSKGEPCLGVARRPVKYTHYLRRRSAKEKAPAV